MSALLNGRFLLKVTGHNKTPSRLENQCREGVSTKFPNLVIGSPIQGKINKHSNSSQPWLRKNQSRTGLIGKKTKLTSPVLVFFEHWATLPPMMSYMKSVSSEKKPYGFGSVQTDSKGFRAIGTKLDANGIKVPVRKRFTTEEAAIEFLEQLDRSKQNAVLPSNDQIPETIRELLRHWLVRLDNGSGIKGRNIDPQTIGEYAGSIRMYHSKQIGDVRLDSKNLVSEISDHRIYIDHLISDKTKKEMSVSRKRNIWHPLQAAFKYGFVRGFVDKNPCEPLTKFYAGKPNLRKKAIPEQEIAKLQAYLDQFGCKSHSEHICQLRWQLAIDYGRRQGELLGLDWKDVHLSPLPNHSYIEIKQRAKRRPWEHGCIESQDGLGAKVYECGKQARYCPKKKGGGIQLLEGTKGGVERTTRLDIDEEVVALFIEHRKAQQQEQMEARDNGTYDVPAEYLHSNLVFTQPKTGRIYGARHDVNIFEKLMLSAKVEKHYTIHQLRHSAATVLLDANDGNLVLVRDLLGHSSITMTQQYVHNEPGSLQLGASNGKAKRKEALAKLKAEQALLVSTDEPELEPAK